MLTFNSLLMKTFKHTYFIIAGILWCILQSTDNVNAQINPLISSYYQNRYINNPAMAGANKGLTLNAGYKRDWADNEGAPVMNVVTADYRTGKMGLGLYINTGSDGLIHNNKYLASYAYHIRMRDEGQLSFGLSGGITTNQINNSDIIGDEGDQSVLNYNDQTAYFDADFGMAYSSGGFMVQGVVQNLRRYLYDEADNDAYLSSLFFTSASYKFSSEVISIEPQVVFRGFRNYSNIVDAGVNASFYKGKFDLLALYHSTKNITAGMSFTFQKYYQLGAAYTSSTLAGLRKYNGGNFEVGIKVNLFND